MMVTLTFEVTSLSFNGLREAMAFSNKIESSINHPGTLAAYVLGPRIVSLSCDEGTCASVVKKDLQFLVRPNGFKKKILTETCPPSRGEGGGPNSVSIMRLRRVTSNPWWFCAT
jgi:hypothetical protein